MIWAKLTTDFEIPSATEVSEQSVTNIFQRYCFTLSQSAIGCVETVQLGSTLKLSIGCFSHHLKVNDQEFTKRLLPGVDTFNVFTQNADFANAPTRRTIVGAPRADLSDYTRLWSFEHNVDRKGLLGIWVVHCIISNANSKKVQNDTGSVAVKAVLSPQTRQARR